MGRIIAHISASIDGYITDTDGRDDFFPFDQSFHDHVLDILSGISGMLFGRRSFDLLSGFWPQADRRGDDNLSQQAVYMNSLPKYVLTHRPLNVSWDQSTAVSLDDLPELKREAKRPIAAFAGASLINQVRGAGLLDELQVLRQPVILGGGTPLFPEGTAPGSFRLVSTKLLTTGAVLEAYRPASKPKEERE